MNEMMFSPQRRRGAEETRRSGFIPTWGSSCPDKSRPTRPLFFSAPLRLCGSIRLSLLVVAASLALGACKTDEKSLAAVDVTADTACSLDGMLLADFPGPKAQIHYDNGKPDFFCDTVEMFSLYLRPEQQKRVKALYVQDMGSTDWMSPKGHWIDAKSAFYVQGSKLKGSMGPTLGSFATEDGAKSFASKNGGKVLAFSAIKPEMVVLDGGSVVDQRM